MPRPFTLLLSSLILALTAQACPQTTSTVVAQQRKLYFSAVVLDSHGAPIRDLHTDDFVVEVAGKAQSAEVQSPPPAEQAKNPARGLIVVVIDAMHTAWSEEKDVRLNAGKYLAACAKADVPVSLYLFSRNGVLTPVHEYTTSSLQLASALQHADEVMHHQLSNASGSPEAGTEAKRLVDFYRGDGDFASRQAIREYPGAILGAFETVAHSVAAIPGRKSLIWVSSTFPFAVDEKQGKILSPTTQSTTATDLIYPNLLTPDQVRRLQTVWKSSIAAAQSSQLALYPVQTRTIATIPIVPEVINSMTSMAHMTGGAEVHLVGDFFGQFLNLADQSRAAYDVTLPTDAAQSCKSDWCPMKITVKRKGARVLAAQGFFRDVATAPEPPTAVAQAPPEPAPSGNPIPFTVDWEAPEGTGAKKKIAFVVTFGADAGIPAAGSAELNLEVIVHAFADGADKQGLSFSANTQLPQATLDEIRKQGFVLNNAIELEPGSYNVRFVVHDKASGRVGVLQLPLKVG